MHGGCVVSGFRCSVNEIFALLGLYSMWNPRKPKMSCRKCYSCVCFSSEVMEETVVACKGTGDAGEKSYWLFGAGSSMKSWMFQPVKIFPAFIEPRDSLTMFTGPHHWTTILSHFIAAHIIVPYSFERKSNVFLLSVPDFTSWGFTICFYVWFCWSKLGCLLSGTLLI